MRKTLAVDPAPMWVPLSYLVSISLVIALFYYAYNLKAWLGDGYGWLLLFVLGLLAIQAVLTLLVIAVDFSIRRLGLILWFPAVVGALMFASHSKDRWWMARRDSDFTFLRSRMEKAAAKIRRDGSEPSTLEPNEANRRFGLSMQIRGGTYFRTHSYWMGPTPGSSTRPGSRRQTRARRPVTTS